MNAFPESITVVDSHTEGEPTRVVVEGWPPPEGATLAERRDSMFVHQDHLRRAVVCEPRGHAAMVGALLLPPVSAEAQAGVVFFNNVGYLGMCGHGLIGVVRTLAFLGRLAEGRVLVDTPAGGVAATLDDSGSVTIENVPAYCHRLDVSLDVPTLGRVTGDIAYGGNWFFLAHLEGVPIETKSVPHLLEATLAIQRALCEAGITGADGAEIDHVEVFGPPSRPDAHSRNFVLCPGGEYDRSPCGTGTSAKLATLHARGSLAVGERWRQESVTGGMFEGWLSLEGETLVPHIRGSAFVTGKATLYFDPRDALRGGF